MAGWIASDAALPFAEDGPAVETGWRRWDEAAGQAEDAALADFMRAAPADPLAGPLLASIFASSPYLTHGLVMDPAFARLAVEEGPEAGFAAALADARERPEGEELAGLMQRLRGAKRRAALAIALADIGGCWPLERVTGALSDLAEATLGAAMRHLLGELHKAGELDLPDPDRPEQGSGLFALGMGKLGARELNYSSDIDLILLFDPDRAPYSGRRGLQPACTRLAQGLMRIMGAQTAEGYVFRTDLRLRPDPGSTPPAVSVRSAAFYYRNAGRNWERAAMIKARTVAGDADAGAAFLESLQPFIWRRHLDFAAAQDIRAIKQQIDAQRKAGGPGLEGHDVKLGRGGIREIEFFVQAQQLIWGGRNPELRRRGTLESLQGLVGAGHVDPGAAAELEAAYRFHRGLEHRLQMVDDRQTHSLPDSAAGLAGIAAFMAFPSVEGFAAHFGGHVEAVERHYGRLFEDRTAPPESLDLSADGEAVEAALAAMGYGEPARAAETLARWREGEGRSAGGARELLARLAPRIALALAEAPGPDLALARFDAFLAGLGDGPRFLSLLAARPELLAIAVEVVGSAPRLARWLASRPLLLESALSRDFTDLELPDEEGLEPELAETARRGLVRLFYAREFGRREMRAELAAAAARAGDFQDLLDLARRWANDRMFQIGAHLLRGRLSPLEAAAPLSDLAEMGIELLTPAVLEAFAARHGRIEGARVAVVAFGALGSREMTLNAPLDLMLLYDAPEALSDGPRPLATAAYHAGLCRRLASALTAPTPEGGFYRLEMRPQPSGAFGPRACPLAALAAFPHERAGFGELAALARARVVWSSDDVLGERFEEARAAALAHAPDRVAGAAAALRGAGAADGEGWDIEAMPGGRRDIEAAAGLLLLRLMVEAPETPAGDAASVFEAAGAAALIDGQAAAELAEAARLWRNLGGIAELAVEDGEGAEAAGPALRAALGQGGLLFGALAETVRETAARATAHVDALLAPGA